MKIQIASDLHLEFIARWSDKEFNERSPILKPTDADVLVLAGDIVGKFDAEDALWFSSLCNHYPLVIYILGNHEFYDKDMTETLSSICPNFCHRVNAVTGKGNFLWLENDYYVIKNLLFLGATFWTNYRKGNPMEMMMAERAISDFSYVTYNSKKLSAADILKKNAVSVKYIETALHNITTKGQKRVVVTHHLPSYLSTTKYSDATLNSAFASQLDNLVEMADVWIHGHTHKSYQYSIGNAQVHCNPRGYGEHGQNKEYKNDYVIEI